MAGDVPEGDIYKGPCGIARESTWLTWEDLPADREAPATIETVRIRKRLVLQGGREKAVGLSLKFVGKERELLLNATNRKVLSLLFGGDTAGWFGKRVLLYVEQDVRRPDGTKGPAVRIRPKRVEATPAGATQPEREPGQD